MSMTVYMLTTVMGESGTLLSAGSSYTVSNNFGAELVGSNRATDVNRVLVPPSTEKIPYFSTDSSGNVTGLVGPDGVVAPLGGATAQTSLASAIAAYKAGLRSRPPLILGIGDSNFTGEGAGTGTGTVPKLTGAFANSPVQQIKNYLPTLQGLRVINTAFFGEGNSSNNATPVAEYDPRLTLGSGWTPSGSAQVIGGRFFETATTAGDLTINFGERVDVVEVFYLVSATGSTTVNVKSSDNTVRGTFSCNNASSGYSYVTVTNSAFNDGIVKITNGAANSAYILGVIAYPTNEQVVVLAQSSCSSAKTADYAATTGYAGLQPLWVIKPDFMLIQLTINDINGGTVIGTYATNWTTILDLASKFGDVVLATGGIGGGTNYTNGTYRTYETQLYKSAGAYGYPVINMHRRFVSWAASNAEGYEYDNNHRTAAGYAVQAQIFANAILKYAA